MSNIKDELDDEIKVIQKNLRYSKKYLDQMVGDADYECKILSLKEQLKKTKE